MQNFNSPKKIIRDILRERGAFIFLYWQDFVELSGRENTYNPCALCIRRTGDKRPQVNSMEIDQLVGQTDIKPNVKAMTGSYIFR